MMEKLKEGQRDILKKDELESSSISCDAWLLPEVKSAHVVHGKETRKVKKEVSPQDQVVESGQSDQATISEAITPESNTPGMAHLESMPALENIIPESLSEFNEPLTLKRLQNIAEDIQRNAWAKGHEEGLKAGIADGSAQITAFATQIDQLAAQLNSLLHAQEQTLQSALHAVVIQIVERLCGLTFQQNPETLESLLKEALDAYPQNADKPTIKLSQSDHDLLKANNMLTEQCAWVVDNDVSPGGFIVSGKYAEVDHTYETRLQQLIDQYFAA